MLDGYRKDAKNDEVRRQIDSWQACMACLAGRNDDAKRLFDSLGSRIVLQSFTDFETTLSEMKLRLAGRGPSELLSRDFNPGVTRLAISADGRRLMALGPATGATLWELQDECRELPSPKGAPEGVIIRDADLSADGRRLALITFESLNQTVPGRLELWDVEASAAVQRFDAQEQFPACVRLSPNGRLLATGTIQGQVLFFDATTGRQADALSKAAHQGIIPFLAFSPDGARLASEDQNGVLKIWKLGFDEQGDLQSVDESHTLGPFPSFAISFAFSPDGKQFLVGHAESELWQLDPVKKLRSVPGSAVAFAPDGATFATGGGALGGSARVWETKSGKERCQLLGGHTSPVFTLIFSPSGKRIVSGSRDFELNQKGSVRCWNAATGEAVPDFGDVQ
jgi:WD40 repeat protein